MTVKIKYQAQIENETISSYAHQWAEKYGDIVAVINETKNYEYAGSYYSSHGTVINPTAEDYNNQSAGFRSLSESDSAVIFQGNLFGAGKPIVVNRGHIESIEFGESLKPDIDNSGAPHYLDNPQMKLSGLDIKGDFYNSMCSMSRTLHAEPGNPYQGGTNQGMYNLLRGNAEPMLEVLKAQGIDVNKPLKDMAIASQFDVTSSVLVNTPVIEAVGSSDGSEILIAV